MRTTTEGKVLKTTKIKRPIYEIAREIRADWKPVSPHARPYLEAMFFIYDVNDYYFSDSGKSVILYFLANASTWRGETARRIKEELKNIVK